jgi:hypothetical protein
VFGFPGECGTLDAAAGRDSMRETEVAAQALGIDNALRTLLGAHFGRLVNAADMGEKLPRILALVFDTSN